MMSLRGADLGPYELGILCALMAVVIPATRWRLFRDLQSDTTVVGRRKFWRVVLLLLMSPGCAMLALGLFLRSQTLALISLPILVVPLFGYTGLMMVAVFRDENVVE